MNELTKIQQAVMAVGAVAVVAGAAAFKAMPQVAAVALTAGALLFAPMQLLQRYDGRSFIIRRLRRQQMLGALALVCAGFSMLMQAFAFGPARRNEWLVFLAIGCVLELYTALRLPAELKKEQ